MNQVLSSGRRGRLRRPGVALEIMALLGILVVYVAGAAWYAAQGTVWSPDSGARLLQVQAILEHGPAWWISYPAEALDPKHQNSSLSFFGFSHGGRTFIFYSFLFAQLSAFFYGHFGFFGLAVLPMLGGLGAAVASLTTARLLQLRFPVAPMLLTALATPVVLFSMVFWDHSVTTGIASGALYLALRGIATRRAWLWFASGALLGLGLWLHEILVPYVPALLAGAWWARRHHRWVPACALLVAGTLSMVIPLAFINSHVYGTPFGPHLSNNKLGSPGAIAQFMLSPSQWGPGALYTLFGWGDVSPAFTWQLNDWLAHPWPELQYQVRASMWMSIPFVAWMVLAASGWWRRLWWLCGLIFIGIAASCVWVLRHDMTPHSSFLVCPLLLLAFGVARPRLRPRSKHASSAAEAEEAEGASNPRLLGQTLALVTAVYTMLTLVKPTLGGIEWGTRHLLSTVPALTVLAWSAIESLLPEAEGGEAEGGEPARGGPSGRGMKWQPGARPLLGMAGAMAVLSVALQVHGVRIVHEIHVRNRVLSDAIASAPDEIIVSTVWWAAMSGATAYNQKKILYAGDPDHPAGPLFSLMAQRGVRTFTLVAPDPRNLSDMARPLGYIPIRGTVRPASYGLYLNRFGRFD